jgi:hypothetical protein
LMGTVYANWTVKDNNDKEGVSANVLLRIYFPCQV